MRKLMFLIVSMVLVGGVNAQNVSAIKSNEAMSASAPQKWEDMSARATVLPSYFNHTMLMPVPVVKKQQKAKTYAQSPYYLLSTSYAESMVGSAGIMWGSGNEYTNSFFLFPDSLAVSHVEHIGNPEGSFNRNNLAAIGFTFDPYSKAFDANFQNRLFETAGGELYGYRIDTLRVCGDYRIANYNPVSPDTLRVFVTSHNAYDKDDAMRNEEYLSLRLTSGAYEGVSFVTPIVDYDDINNIPQKGSPIKPISQSLKVYDYILSPNDSAQWQIGFQYLRVMNVPIDYEVTVGHVTSFSIKFIPGYAYDNGDTVEKTVYNPTTQQTVSQDLRLNKFAISTINNTNFSDFLDWGLGYNCRLAESMDLRYYPDSSLYTHITDKQAYVYNYYAIPFAYMVLSVDDGDYKYIGDSVPSIMTSSLPNGRVGTAYNQTLIASGKPTITWSMISGNLPNGLSLDTTGKITGTPTIDGKFDFRVLASNNIDTMSKEFSITIVKANDNVSESISENFKIYPNPASEQVKIELINGGTAELSIMNIMGQVLRVASLNEMENTIDLSSLSSGIYVLKITQGGRTYNTKVTKR